MVGHGVQAETGPRAQLAGEKFICQKLIRV